MNTYAYFVVANISNETTKKKESIKGNPFSLYGKTKPTHRSTRDITRVASSPIVTAFVVLCCIILLLLLLLLSICGFMLRS